MNAVLVKRVGWSATAVTVALLVVVGVRVFLSTPPNTLPQEDAVVAFDDSLIPALPLAENASVQPAPKKSNTPSASLLHQAKHYEINLVETFDEVRSRCLPEWDRQQCNEMTRNFLQERIADNDKAELLKVYDQYVQYEDYVAAQRPLQHQDLENTYQILQQLRTQFIDADIRAWLFGPEDARMNYEFALRDFVAQKAARLKPVERLQRLEQLRQIHLGEYYSLFLSRENSVDYYQLQLELLTMGPEITEETARLVVVMQEKIQAAIAVTANDPTDTGQ